MNSCKYYDKGRVTHCAREMTFYPVCVCGGGVASRCVVYMWGKVWDMGHRDRGYLGCAFTTGGGLEWGRGKHRTEGFISRLRQTPDQIGTTPFQLVVQLVHCFPPVFPTPGAKLGSSCNSMDDSTDEHTAHRGRGARLLRLSCRYRPLGGVRQTNPGCCQSPAGPPPQRRPR